MLAQRPSMGQEMAKGRRTEIEYLNGFVVREGERAGIPARQRAPRRHRQARRARRIKIGPAPHNRAEAELSIRRPRSPRIERASRLGKNAVGWKNVVGRSRPRFARHLRMRNFSKFDQQHTFLLRSDPAQPGRVSKHARRPIQRILTQPLRDQRLSAYKFVGQWPIGSSAGPRTPALSPRAGRGRHRAVVGWGLSLKLSPGQRAAGASASKGRGSAVASASLKPIAARNAARTSAGCPVWKM